MAFQFHHRKLLNDSLSDPPDCELVCNALWIPSLNCPSTCLTVCPAVCISPPPPISVVTDFNKHRQLSVHLIAILAVLATAFFLFTCYTVYKICTYRRNRSLRRMPSQRRHPDEEADGGDSDDFFDLDRMAAVVDHPIWYIRTVGLQPSVINAITVVKYKKSDGLVEGTDCAVCLSEFEEDETLRLLPKCNHAFHIPCIDTWLGSHTNCPLCRAGIVTAAAGPSPPTQELVSRDSGRVEEARLESVRVGTGSEDDESESGGEMNDDVDRGSHIELQPVRRSISMDSVSASIISAAINNGFAQQCERSWELGAKETKEEDGGERVRVVGVQTGSSSIKRSTSCGSKVFLARHSSRS